MCVEVCVCACERGVVCVCVCVLCVCVCVCVCVHHRCQEEKTAVCREVQNMVHEKDLHKHVIC